MRLSSSSSSSSRRLEDAVPTLAPTFRPTLNNETSPTHAPISVSFTGETFSAEVIAVAINFGSMFFVMYLLRLLLKMALTQIEEVPEYKLHSDPGFQDEDLGQNWNWDFVLVTGIKPEDQAPLSDFLKKNSMLRIVQALRRAGLETVQFKSQDWKKIIIKIRATAKRLKEQADKLDMRLRLDEKEVKKRLSEGQPDATIPGEYLIYPRRDGWTYKGQEMYTAIKDTENQCPYAYNQYMYGRYEGSDGFQTLYQKYALTSSIFRSVDRIKLILSILKWPDSDNGAGLSLEKMIRQGAILHAFPLQDLSELRQVQRKWLVYWAWPWNQPFNRIKDYFGEKIAMYFLFLGHYTTAVMVAAAVGTVFYFITVIQANPNSPAIPVFCVFMALWATLFVEFWKRKQSRFAMMWGMVGTERTAEERPEFTENPDVESISSPVTGDDENYFPPSSRAKRGFVSSTVIATSGLGVLAVVVMIFFLKADLTARNNFLGTRSSFKDVSINRRPVRNWGIRRSWDVVDFASTVPGIVVSLINAIQIFALEPVFSGLAERLTDYECHRTDTEYEDSLTAKVFVFQFINSFTSYLYIAFFKQSQSEDPDLQASKGYKTSLLCPIALDCSLVTLATPAYRISNVAALGRRWRAATNTAAATAPRAYYACIESCMDELQTQLGSIFISKVILANVKDILLPYSKWSVKRLQQMRQKELEAISTEQDEMAATQEAAESVEQGLGNQKDASRRKGTAVSQENETTELRQLSPAEEQMQLAEYNILLGPFGDYRDLVIIYGYTVLFVAAFPLAPLMALVNSYVQIRSDAWHISVCCRRPWPSNAEDIGTWASIIELTSYFAVIVNSLIIVYTGTFLKEFTVADRLLIFMGLYHGLFIVKYVVAILVDDIPRDVRIQVARQEFCEAKLIKMQQDDVIEVEIDEDAQRQSNQRIPDVTIHDKDDDVVYLDYPGYEDYMSTAAALYDTRPDETKTEKRPEYELAVTRPPDASSDAII
ncbi:hypothetical protein CTAYLR_001924 [Chrysophaeum taylorii]|uniref:Anoctamin transmembrane domain-containing protein n=1 Tax=Chrysophaeum taylorii TaxID=2483200 RepID=A0AAD7U8R1_9STRA|nr:hypothetical protein CTAYLR_001924 [Chrysophaeum taylorii]